MWPDGGNNLAVTHGHPTLLAVAVVIPPTTLTSLAKITYKIQISTQLPALLQVTATNGMAHQIVIIGHLTPVLAPHSIAKTMLST